MSWYFTGYSNALLIAAGITLITTAALWNRRSLPGASSLMTLIGVMTVWAFGAGMQAASPDPSTRLFWAKIEFISACCSAPLIILFSLDISRCSSWLTRRNLSILWLPVVFLAALAATNEFHSLVWAGSEPAPIPGSNLYIYKHGIAFWFFMAYIYLCIGMASLRLAQVFQHMFQTYRLLSILMMIALTVPWVASLIYIMNINPIPGLKIVPLSFAVTGLLITYCIFQLRFLEQFPTAREILVELMSDGILVLDSYNNILDMNPAARTFLGITNPAVGKPVQQILEDFTDILDFCQAEPGKTLEVHIKGSAENEYELELTSTPLETRRGVVSGRIILMRDISIRIQAEETLRDNEENLRKIFSAAPLPLAVTLRSDSTILFANQKVYELYGEGIGLLDKSPKAANLYVDETDRERILAILQKDGYVENFETRIKTARGERWVAVSMSPILYNDQQCLLNSQFDLTERKKAEEVVQQSNQELRARLEEIQRLQSLLREQAIRDSLTGLYNRRFMEETLERELARAEREQYPVSVIMLDLDLFKNLNDTYGHKAGDLVLESLGSLLLKHVRRGDIPCRYGGEEFVVIMSNANLNMAQERAEELRSMFAATQLTYGEHKLRSTFSAGVAAYPLHGKNTDELLKEADAALYRAKSSGRNCVRLAQG